mmetsp:Transcript_5533/g.19032  ORF Transcript_5533/g.19032 Transcript_5533/m.19032 type:complete len:215 (-) Transcript_5533:2291-2935(-)
MVRSIRWRSAGSSGTTFTLPRSAEWRSRKGCIPGSDSGARLRASASSPSFSTASLPGWAPRAPQPCSTSRARSRTSWSGSSAKDTSCDRPLTSRFLREMRLSRLFARSSSPRWRHVAWRAPRRRCRLQPLPLRRRLRRLHRQRHTSPALTLRAPTSRRRSSRSGSASRKNGGRRSGVRCRTFLRRTRSWSRWSATGARSSATPAFVPPRAGSVP